MTIQKVNNCATADYRYIHFGLMLFGFVAKVVEKSDDVEASKSLRAYDCGRRSIRSNCVISCIEPDLPSKGMQKVVRFVRYRYSARRLKARRLLRALLSSGSMA